jgi:hypothetical protein
LVETQPQTLADSATILHFILDHGGLDNTAVTATAIENVLAMIEREAREGGAA